MAGKSAREKLKEINNKKNARNLESGKSINISTITSPLEEESIELKEEKNEEINEQPMQIKTAKAVVKNRPGRPKEKEGNYKALYIEVPESLYNQITFAKQAHDNNLTKYITTVIKKDIEVNGNKYKQLAELKKAITV